MKNKTLKAIEKLFKNNWHKWVFIAILGVIVFIIYLFYSFIYKPIYEPRDLVPEKLEIDKIIYDELINFCDLKEQNINQIIKKEYSNIFK
ncbi:hypothetical protein KJ684_00490 [Patescibacteria group bacterium]|nr:hypothetical protein [Patescibacteria group bacterium]